MCVLLVIRDPGGIRTHDPQLRRLLLYPAELPDHLLNLFSRAQRYINSFEIAKKCSELNLFLRRYENVLETTSIAMNAPTGKITEGMFRPFFLLPALLSRQGKHINRKMQPLRNKTS